MSAPFDRFEFSRGLSSGICGAVLSLELLARYLIFGTFGNWVGSRVKDLRVGSQGPVSKV